ncbi:YihY family inner membrane protein [Iodobacter fluviatilis]|uniref:YihY family inner membrane protein n=1 Tax=Iodobacter fluviatilis TaxID=537 RepID=UPI00155929AB|nr:YihY family inner membrane protein [Iodobacter fluviatilis]
MGRRLVADRCLQTAGSLTYTTLLALIPLLTIALSLFSAFPMFGDYSSKFKIFLLTNLVPDASGKVISVYMRQFSDNAERLTAMGMIGLLVTALLLIFTIEKTFNEVWGVKRPRKLLQRTIIYWAALTLGPLIIGISISLTSWLYAQTGLHSDASLLNLMLLKLGPMLLMLGSLTLLYLAVPNCYVPRSHAFISALVVAAALELMKRGFGLYIQQFGTFKLIYGAFASFPIFLMWLYVSWVIILGGAVLSACLSYWHASAWRWEGNQGTRLEQSIRLLLVLAEAHSRGEILHIDKLRRKTQLGLDTSYSLLEEMALKNWVESTRDGEWILAVDLQRITLRDVFETMVTPLSARLEAGLSTIHEELKGVLEMSLAEYAAKKAETILS